MTTNIDTQQTAQRSLQSMIRNSGFNPLLASQRTPLPEKMAALLARPVDDFRPKGKAKKSKAAPQTHIAFVLDCSHSMSPARAETIAGYNKQMLAVKDGAKDVGAAFFTAVHFGSQVDVKAMAASLDSLEPLSNENYVTTGGTALNDGIGRTLEVLLDTKGIDNPNTATLVTVFTDGEENASRTYSPEDIKGLIERLEATGRWTFALIGPDRGVKEMAATLSFPMGNVTGYNVESKQDRTRVFDDVAHASSSFMTLRGSGLTQSASLYASPEQTSKAH